MCQFDVFTWQIEQFVGVPINFCHCETIEMWWNVMESDVLTQRNGWNCHRKSVSCVPNQSWIGGNIYPDMSKTIVNVWKLITLTCHTVELVIQSVAPGCWELSIHRDWWWKVEESLCVCDIPKQLRSSSNVIRYWSDCVVGWGETTFWHYGNSWNWYVSHRNRCHVRPFPFLLGCLGHGARHILHVTEVVCIVLCVISSSPDWFGHQSDSAEEDLTCWRSLTWSFRNIAHVNLVIATVNSVIQRCFWLPLDMFSWTSDMLQR